MNAEQLFLDPLIEPSLHRKRSPSQPAMPPFLPEQGLLAAMTSIEAKPNAAAMTKHSPKGTLCSCEGKLFIVAYRGSPTKTARPVSPSHPEGGVDAVAFDPDPIRGGKIVIQAKRYTNTVGVGAVRDLYGTVLNEGATKGILVTTSDYGPDSYAFAAGKPLVLLSGANLLHMLQKHGHKARIDLKEAKKMASTQ